MKAAKPVHDIDYGQRNFLIEADSGVKWMRYGVGPLWSYGMPDIETVWASDEYAESVYDFEGVIMVDARGVDKEGKLWRFFGKLGESVDYNDLDATEAHLFDQVIDGVCILEDK